MLKSHYCLVGCLADEAVPTEAIHGHSVITNVLPRLNYTCLILHHNSLKNPSFV